jgi:hypothetical protein
MPRHPINDKENNMSFLNFFESNKTKPKAPEIKKASCFTKNENAKITALTIKEV